MSLAATVCAFSSISIGYAQAATNRCTDDLSFQVLRDSSIPAPILEQDDAIHALWPDSGHVVLTTPHRNWFFSGSAGVEVFFVGTMCVLDDIPDYFSRIEVWSGGRDIEKIGIGMCQSDEAVCIWIENTKPD